VKKDRARCLLAASLAWLVRVRSPLVLLKTPFTQARRHTDAKTRFAGLPNASIASVSGQSNHESWDYLLAEVLLTLALA